MEFNQERPHIVTKDGQHLVWDPSSHTYVAIAQDEQDREKAFGDWPESFSGEDPARDTEIPSNPRSFGTFSSDDGTGQWGMESVPTLNYVEQNQPCPQCHQPIQAGQKQCPHCMWPIDEPVLNTKQQAGGAWSGGGFPDVVPKMNYNNQGDNGVVGKSAALDFSMPAPVQAPAQGQSPEDESHRFVVDENGQVFMEPVPLEHHDIVNKYGINEMARGSVYNNGTADVHRAWGPLDQSELERTLGHYLGQHSVPIKYMPGQAEGQTAGNTAHGIPIAPMRGYIWRREQGAPHPDLASSVPLVFASEHTTPEDYPLYQQAKGFLTATGGGTSHAVVEGRQRGMGGAVGIGPDYNKVVHGAPVTIREDGSVEFEPYDPNSIVSEYFSRGEPEWEQSRQERARKNVEFRKRTPEGMLPNRGGSVFEFDKSNDELAIEAMTFGPRIAANLDECPECGDVMVDRPEGKVCANCGHTQKIITTEARQSGILDDIGGGLKDTGEFAYHHPLETAGLVGLGALAVPTGGADLALAPEVEGLAAAGDAGIAAAPAAEEAATGLVGDGLAGPGTTDMSSFENAAANPTGVEGDLSTSQSPGRVKSLLNSAKSTGKGALMYQGLNSMLNGGGGGGAGASGPSNDYSGQISSVDPRFAFWQYGSDDEAHGEKSIGIGGTSDSGEGSTDPMTLDSQQETGDSDDLLKMLGDDGSANRGAYSDDQKAALDHFNNNLPVIVELALDDSKDHSDHPVIQELTQLLEHAFPGDNFGGEHHEEHAGIEDDSHKHEDQSEAHDADKDDEQSKIGKTAGGHKPGCECGFCKNKGKLPGANNDTDDDSDEEESEEVKESSWRMSDMNEDEIAALFAGEPVLELDLGTSPEGTFHEGEEADELGTTSRIAAPAEHNYKVNPAQPNPDNEEEETPEIPEDPRREVKNEVLNDAFLGRTADVVPSHPNYDNQIPAPSGESPAQMTEQAQGSCPGCNTQQVPGAKFCHNCGLGQNQAGADQQSAPSHHMAPEQGNQAFARTAADPMTAPAAPQHRTVPGPDSAIDTGIDWAKMGIQEGGTYMMKSKNYSIPDEVTVKQIKPTSIVVEIKGNGITFPNEISADDVHNDGLSFEPIGQAAPQEVQQAQQGAAPTSAPGANEVTDLSETPTSISHAEEESNVEPINGLIYTDQETGDPISYQQYAASLRAQAPPHLAWLWDNVQEDLGVTEREEEMMAYTAGRDYTHSEQRAFINEPGEARNKDKMDLSGTHYLEDTSDIDDELWMA